MTIKDSPFYIAIGASGSEGLTDIQELLGRLSRLAHAVVMVVLHRPTDEISHLQDVLARSCKMPVIIATEATVLERGKCYIGEPDGHLTLVDKNRAHLVFGSGSRLRGRTIDTLFNSLADYAGPRTIGVVLSGSLDDGSRGLAAIHKANGLTMVLDPGLKIRGMQQNAIDFDGPISFVGTGQQIAEVIIQATAEDRDLLPVTYALVTTDEAGHIVGWNAGASAMFGWRQAEILGRSYASLFKPKDSENGLLLTIPNDLGLTRSDKGERWCVRKDGSHFLASSLTLSGQADGLYGLVIILQDQTKPRPIPASLHQSEAQFRLLTETIPQLVWRSLDNGNWNWASPQWVAYTGQEEVASHGWGWKAMVHSDDQAVTTQAWEAASSRGGLDVEHRLRRADGVYRWFQTRAVPLQEERSVGPRQWFGTSTDIDGLRQAEERIQFLAYHDALTGAANRALLEKVLDQTTSDDGQGPSWCNVLYVDLDRFKSINDQFGHRGGDDLLKQVTDRLRGCLRDGDLLARSGGDEFVLVQRVGPSEEPTALATRVVTALSRGFTVRGQDLAVSASIGVASCVQNGTTPEELLLRADLALYEAKSAGGGSVRIYDPAMEADQRYRQTLERDLRRAIENGELMLHYQPIVNIVTNDVVGFEALARWTHPLHGPVPPNIFVSLAEKSDLILALGTWALEHACDAAATSKSQRLIAVNVSPAQFRHGDLALQISEVLSRTGLAAEWLELEVTEGLLMEDSEQVLNTLKAIKSLGVRVALDDFGTGYSSLGYLCRFPFDKVKIDQSFIRRMEDDSGAFAIVKAVVALADSLHLEVTAEGVETETQLAMLRGIGCKQAQGFLLGRPSVDRHVN